MEDRRRHARFPASERSYMVGLSSPAYIMDISDGGLGVKYKGAEILPEQFTVDLLHASKSLIIDRVKCRKTRDETVPRITAFSYLPERRLGIEFLEPSDSMLDSLHLFKEKAS